MPPTFAEILGAQLGFHVTSADLSTSPVEVWTDRSPRKSHPRQATVASRPTLSGGIVSFDASNDVMQLYDTRTLVAQIQTPDVSDTPIPGQGFTITGLAHDAALSTASTRRFWAGDHGLEGIAPTDVTYNAKFVKVAVDIATGVATNEQEILLVPLVPSATSVQGVAILAGTLWCALLNEGLLVNVSTAGALLGTRNVTAIGNGQPNGLAAHSDGVSLWVTFGVEIYRLRASDAAILEGPYTAPREPDGLTTDPEGQNWLWYGTNNTAYAFDLDTEAEVISFNITGVTSGEGIAWADGLFCGACDGLYHADSPFFNQIRFYAQYAAIVHQDVTSPEINLFYVAPVASNASGTECLFQFGDALAVPGVGVYRGGATTLRVFAFAGAQAFADFTLNPETRARTRLRFDFGAETIECWVNEVQVGSAVSISAISGGVGMLGRPRLGAAVEGGSPTRFSSLRAEAIIATLGSLSADKIAACWAELPA